ncbi:unnamed protein product [Tilletia controversa]|nr:unnamed protein product [Tilletia controversa]
MERWQRGQELAEEDQADDNDPMARQEAAAAEEQQEHESDSEDIGVTNFGLQTPAFVNTRRRERAPLPHQLLNQSRPELGNQRDPGFHPTIPAREPRASTFTTPTSTGLSPLDRFQQLSSQDRRRSGLPCGSSACRCRNSWRRQRASTMAIKTTILTTQLGNTLQRAPFEPRTRLTKTASFTPAYLRLATTRWRSLPLQP